MNSWQGSKRDCHWPEEELGGKSTSSCHIFMVGVTAPDPCVTFNLPQTEVLALTRDRKGASVRELTEIRMAVFRPPRWPTADCT
jgi:hypothetical protein